MKKKYTFNQNKISSRIDSIYVSSTEMENCDQWSIKFGSGITTDHALLTVSHTPKNLPYLGKGRYAIPQHIYKNQKAMEQIEKLGREILDKMELVSETENPSESIQLLAKKWKNDACATLWKAAKIEIPKLKQKIDNLNIKYDLVLNDDTLSEDEKSESAAILLQQIIKLE